MTNMQLLLSIGIPSLLIVLSWLTNNTRFDRIERRLDGHDIMRQLTALHERIAVVEEKQRAS